MKNTIEELIKDLENKLENYERIKYRDDYEEKMSEYLKGCVESSIRTLKEVINIIQARKNYI